MKAMMRKGKLPKKKINFVGMGGDGATADIGMVQLSGALERGHDMIYICYDNEAYMNTGIQRSSSTPYGASTTTSPAGKKSIGQHTQKKNMVAIAAAHNIPYVATACPSFPFDLLDKVKRASEMEARRISTSFRYVRQAGASSLRMLSNTGDSLLIPAPSPFMKW
jgi:pyruvate ferredoxin oxidoreductase beta subunit